jgi:hypothetical protein
MNDNKAPAVRAVMQRYQLTDKGIKPILTRIVVPAGGPSLQEVLQFLAEMDAEMDASARS